MTGPAFPATETFSLPREGCQVPISVRCHVPSCPPRAIVQLVHGMAEHIRRYDEVAAFLSSEGFVTTGHDHRGHGPDWPKDRLGYFAPKDGWQAILNDTLQVTHALKERWPGLPLILLGHSMGSFLAREYAIRFSGELKALVLSGTGYYGRSLVKAGKLLASLSPAAQPAKMVDRIAFSGNNKAFSPPRTPVDWLSRDPERVDAYAADPLCGFLFTGKAYADFFGGLEQLTHPERLKAMRQDLPVLFISGDRDPVGDMGRGVQKVYQSFLDAGMKDVTLRLYPGARHELFNETNRDEVFRDLSVWLKQQAGAGKEKP